jgi:hypothetical protein
MTNHMKYNINETIRVKLTPYGRAVHMERHFNFWRQHRPNNIPIYTPKEEQDGWTRWQLWELMEVFGEYVGLCKQPVFETEIEIPVKEGTNNA